MPDLVCYLLASFNSQRTYIGATKELSRRIRQHNGELVGGAKATRKFRPWTVKVTCGGFATWRETLSFEWKWKRDKRYKIIRGLRGRILRAIELCSTSQFQNRIELRMHEEAIAGDTRDGEAPCCAMPPSLPADGTNRISLTPSA